MLKIEHFINKLCRFQMQNYTNIPVKNHIFSLRYGQRQMHKGIWHNKIVLQSHIKNIEKSIYYKKNTPIFFTPISSYFSSTTTTTSQDLSLNESTCERENKFQKSEDNEQLNNNLGKKNFDKLTGAQEFKDVIKSGYYVDKTKYLQNLIEIGSCSFLIRPKRFGKSLLLNTAVEICKGKRSKKLFENTAIGNSSSTYEWKKFPVLKFDFSDFGNDCIEVFKQDFRKEIIANYNKYNIKYDENESNIRSLLIDLFDSAVNLGNDYERRIVILVDEYDSPLYNCKIKDAIIHEMRLFFASIKKNHIGISKQMVLVTGDTRFGMADIFHAANNLIDITHDEDVNAICGFTRSEMTSIFADQITNMSVTLKKTEEQILDLLTDHYNGYIFSERSIDETIYNPWSIIQCFKKKKICSYWEGRSLSEHNSTFKDIKSMLAIIKDSSFFADDYDLTYHGEYDKISFKSFLFQAGYLTIKKYDEETQKYTLMVPNIDVKESLKNMIDSNKFFCVLKEKNSKLLDSLLTGSAQEFIECLKPIYSSWPYYNKICESTYHMFLHALLKGMSELSHELKVISELPNSEGRVDITVTTPQYIIIFELKYVMSNSEKQKGKKNKNLKINKSNESDVVESVKQAINQIHNNEYFLQYKDSEKTVLLVGMVFSGTKIAAYDVREMKEFLAEKEKEKKK